MKIMDTNFGNVRMLFVSAHPDDSEVGCGGTMTRNTGNAMVRHLILSLCLEDPRNKNILEEAVQANKLLGVKQDNLIVRKLPRRIFQQQRPKIREILIAVRDDYEPTIIFCPSLRDVHQDHCTTAEEALRIFRDQTMFAYESPRSTLFFQPNAYVKLSKEMLHSKIEALKCYRSQFDRYYFKADAIQAIARMRGTECRSEYAEAFEVLRLVM